MRDRSVEDRLGAVERHTNSNDQRLTKLESLYQSVHAGITSILAFQQAHSERVGLMDERFTQRFDDLEKLIRESRNGDGS